VELWSRGINGIRQPARAWLGGWVVVTQVADLW
jgi:hypothetical protein